MNYIGIDPGLQGGVVIIPEEKEEIHPGGTAVRTKYEIETFTMPVIPIGKKKAYNHLALRQFFVQFDAPLCYAILEEQHAMPKQGVVSMMSIGYGFGTLKQCLVDFTIPHEVVRAQVWQKEFGISGRKGNTKAQALQICQSLFPNLNLLATKLSKKPHEGIVDAVLIAEYARRRFRGNTGAEQERIRDMGAITKK